MIHDEELHWFALLTRSNFENKVTQQIKLKKIDYFLPTMRKPSRRKDRKLMIEIPLFPGYVFVKSTFDPAHQLAILKTMGAVRLLGNSKSPIPIPDPHIQSLRLMTQTQTDLITGDCSQLVPGDPVVILEGPMAGVKGEFFQHKNQGRIVVKLDLLGQYAAAEIDAAHVEKIPDLLS